MRVVCYIVSAVVFAGAVHANGVQVKAAVDRTVISLSDTLQLQIIVDGSQEAVPPSLRDLTGFRVIQGPGVSTEMSVVNGRMTSKVTYSYVLAPVKEGTFTIGPLPVKVSGQAYQTQPIAVEIVQARAPASTRDTTDPGAEYDNVFVLTQADKTNVYQNEQVLLTVTLYFRDIDVDNVSPPDATFDGFTCHPMDTIQERRMVNNVIYNTVRFQRLLIPIKTGRISLPPMPLTLTVRETVSRNRRGMSDDGFFGGGLFNDFFGRFRRVNRVVQSNPLTINVTPLPRQGRPASFSGAVGEFRMRAAAAPREVRAGEPVTLTVELTGEGNIDDASISLATNVPGMRMYDPEVQRESSVSNGRLVGKKTYKQMFVPTREGNTSVPAVQFSYFDVNEDKYVEDAEGPFPLKVAPAPRTAVRVTELATPDNAGSVRVLTQDILDIKPEADQLVAGRPAYHYAGFATLLALPPIIWLLAFGSARWQRRLKSDAALARRLGAGRQMKSRLAHARLALRQKEGQRFYSELSDAVCHFIADNLHIPTPQVSAATIRTCLAGTRVSDETAARVERLLEACDFGRFSAAAFEPASARTHLHEAEHLISRMGKELR